jgi:MFS family permease
MTPSAPQQSTRGQWLALTAALLGWMFDGLEMGLFPIVAPDALRELLGPTTSEQIPKWIAVITAVFLIGAATGGVLFGWLGDRIGRVRAMSLSILTYALFSGACGLATDAWQVAVCRFIASLGMGGEWSLGVALVMEVWPNRSRAWLAGLIGASANLGYMAIAAVSLGLSVLIGDLRELLLAVGIGSETTARLIGNNGWRLLMLFGAMPALLTLLIYAFVPESHRWQQERDRGATSHWDSRDLIGVLVGAAAALAMIYLLSSDLPVAVRIGGSLAAFAILTYGYLYPVLRYIQRATGSAERSAGQVRWVVKRLLLAACLSGVALLGTWGSVQQIPPWVNDLTGNAPRPKAYAQLCASGGAVLGCFLAALAGDWLGRRVTYMLLCIGSMGSIALLFQTNTEFGPMLLACAFLAGMVTAAFYGWLPLYLPELFPTKIRATGQGFGYNFGRALAAVGVLQLPTIMRELGVGWAQACTALALVYIVGMVLIWFAPETKGKPLPD